MLTLPDRAGPHDPVPVTPMRRPLSVRRTSSIDSSRPKGLEGDVSVDARARDLITDASGGPEGSSDARLIATIDLGRMLRSASTDPSVDGFDDLIDTPVASGWRSRAAASLPIDERRHALLNLLVDDLPGASLVSGVALQAAHMLPTASPTMRLHVLAAADICAGWIAGGSMMEAFREHDQIPTPVGPPAPAIENPDDAAGWHEMGSLGPHSTRRRRRLDLWKDPDGEGTHAFEAHFRDSHVDGAMLERVVHEYVVTGRVDAATRTFTEVAAAARVLPWVECPNALASADRLVGTPIGGVRTRVRADFVGTTTCTHLNDTLRSLADIDPWLDRLTAAVQENGHTDA